MPRPPRFDDKLLPNPVLGGPRALPVIRGKIDGAECLRCPFSRNGEPNRPVVGEGHPDPAWLIIGEGPGGQETVFGRPFIGPSGHLVNKALAAIRRPREELYVSNATLCKPFPNALDEDKKLARKCCEPRFRAEIMQWPDRPILALGAIAARAFIGSRFSINEMSGSYHRIDNNKWGNRVVIPTIHPAAILRGGSGIGGAHSPDLAFWNLIYDAAKLDSIARGKDIRFREEDIATEVSDPARADRLIERIVADARASGMIAVDTETYVDDEKRHTALQPLNAKMSAIGLATEGWGVSVSWDVMTPHARQLVAAVFADLSVVTVMHNRLYDRPVLDRHGMPVSGQNDDTMLMHHSAFPGLSHNLQRVGTQYFAITPWKSEFRKGHDTPENLTKYCLMAGTPVLLADGTTEVIEQIVRQRKRVEVLTQAPDGSLEHRRVVDWHKARVENQQWIQILPVTATQGQRGLIVTPDHEVYTTRGRVRADRLRNTDHVVYPELAFTEHQRQAVLGTLLGDSTLAVSPSFRTAQWDATRCALQGSHTTTTKLTQHKQRVLRDHLKLGKEIPAQKKTIRGKETESKPATPYFTGMLYQLRELAERIYDDTWTRRVKDGVLDEVGDVGLAWLYMDNGSRQNKKGRDTVTLSFQGFSAECAERAHSWFKNRFGEGIALDKVRVLRLARAATVKFCRAIAPHIPPPLRYKLPHNEEWPAYVPYLAPVNNVPVAVPIRVSPYTPKRETRTQRLRAETRFCITVEGNHNFFTSFGLVSNCAKDTLVTARLYAPLQIALKKTASERTYEIDLRATECAEWMHRVGVPISRPVNQELYDTFLSNMIESRRVIEDAALSADIQPKLWERLAFEQAKRYRKGSLRPGDPADFKQRRELRLAELRTSYKKGYWRFSPSSAAHARALCRTLGINLPTTAKGRASVTQKALRPYCRNPAIAAMYDYRTNKDFAAREDARRRLDAMLSEPKTRETLWKNIAHEQAFTVRKESGTPPDPDDFEERVEKRLEEIRELDAKGRWEWRIGSSEHIVAYLKARGVPMYFLTPSGKVSTKKEILEGFAHLPEVRALLDYRENQKMFSTFCYRLFDRYDNAGNVVKYGYADENDRIHPRWSVHKITGRWGAEGPQCFDGQTEILTPQGWIRFDELPRDVPVAQYHREDGSITFVKPTEYIKKQHQGEMVRITGRYVDLLTTLDHGLLLRKDSGILVDVAAGDYRCKRHEQFLHAGEFTFGTETLNDDEITLLCAAQADGTPNNSGIDFQFTKKRKIERLIAALDRAGIPYSRKERSVTNPFKPGHNRRRTRIYVKSCPSTAMVIRLLQGKQKLFGPWLLGLTRKTIDTLLDEVEFWDGLFTRGKEYYSSTEQNIDWIQILFSLSRKRAVIRQYLKSRIQKKPNWQVRCSHRDSSDASVVIKRVHWDDLVYCVNVPSRYLVVRRNKKVVITKNCQNWPKADKKKGRPNLRAQVIAPPGRMFVGFDFAQLEARIIALYSGDPFLVNIFRNHKDIHSEFARVVWPNYDSLPIDRRKKLRDTIKRPEYGAFYGGQIDTLWKNVVKDFPDVKIQDIARMVDLMTAKMPGVTLWHNKLLRDVAVAPHEIRSIVYGRRRCFPLGNADINDVFNFPVQCLRGDQRVLTTNGWKPISRLIPGVDVLVQPSGNTTSDYKLRSTGKRDVYEVRTQGRRIYCTTEHRFLTYVRDGKVSWMKTRYLKPGRHLAVSFLPAQEGYDPPGVCPEIAEVLGAMIGDGWYAGRGFVITCTTKKYAKHLKKLIETAWPDMPDVRINKVKKRRREHKQLWLLSSETRLADARLTALNVLPATAKTKSLPAWAETASLKTRISLLKGLFDSDGGHGGVDVGFTTVSLKLARTVQRLLFSVGIDARHYTNSTCERVIIRPTSLALFEQLIGFSYGVKRHRLATRKHKRPTDRLPKDLVQYVARKLKARIPERDKDWTTLDHARLHRALQGSASKQQMEKIFAACRRWAEVDDIEAIYEDGLKFHWEEIVSVKKVDKAQTFELDIADDHGYIAEGFVTHNSSGADIMATGLLRMMERLKNYKNAFPILQIHDAMVFECDEDDAERLKHDVQECFEQEHEHNGVVIPFPVDPEVGRSWAEV